MEKKFFLPLAAVFLVYSIAILARYSLGYPELAPLPVFADFVFRVIAIKFLFVFLLASSAYGIGGVLFRKILPDFGSLLEEALVKVPLGLLVISYGVFAIGLAGLLYPVSGYVLLAACIAAGAKELHGFFGRLIKLTPRVELTLAGALLLSATVYLLMKGLYQAFLPPTGFDVLMYHYGVPKLYIDAHGIFSTPDINGSSYPFFTEMLYTLAMLVEGEISANMVNFFFAAGCGLAIYAYSRRFLKSASPAVAPAIFFGVPLVLWLLPQAYVEFSHGFFIFMAIYAMAAWLGDKKGDDRWLYVSAVLMGVSMCIKYTSNLVLVIMLAGVLYRLYFVDRAGLGRTAVAALKYSAIGLVIVMPWYVKNLVWYGNPFFPMLASGGKNAGELNTFWKEGMSTGPLSMLTLPWRLTMNPKEFWAGDLNSVGPYLLMFMPGLLLFRRLEKELKYLMAFSALYMVSWFFTAQSTRYLIPVLPGMAILAGYPAGRLLVSGGRAYKWLGTSLAGVLAFAAVFANTGSGSVDGFPSANAQTRDAYYTGQSARQGFLSSYEEWKWINDNLPQDAVIYQLWDDASVYFRKRKTLGFPSDVGVNGRDKVIYLAGRNSFGGFRPGEEIIANLKAMGAGYLLINANREGRAVPEDQYFREHTRLILENQGILLYQVM